MQAEPGKRAVCVLDVGEEELKTINEWVRKHRGEKQMTKLTKDMLGLRIDKNFKNDVTLNPPIFNSLAEWLDFMKNLLESLDGNAKQIETLTSSLKQKTEDAEKYKSQLTSVLIQFKSEREKHTQAVVRLNSELETKTKDWEQISALKGQTDQSKTTKLEETFSKLFEKGEEIRQLKEQNMLLQAALESSEKNALALRNRLRLLLAMDRSLSSTKRTFDQESSFELNSVHTSDSSPELIPAKQNKPASSAPTLHSVMICPALRQRLLSFLPLESQLPLRQLDMLTHRSLSLDFWLVKSLHQQLSLHSQKQVKLAQDALEVYKGLGYKHASKHTSYVFYKHAYLRNTSVTETFGKCVSRCAAVVQLVTGSIKDKANYVAQQTGTPSPVLTNREALLEEESKAKQLKESKTGFFKSFIDKVDFGGTKLSDMLGMPKNTTKTFKELEEHYLAHLDLFKRVGLIYGEQEDFEVQLSQREHQIHTLEVRIGETCKYLEEYMQSKNVTYASLGLEPEDLNSFVSIVFFSSLQLQECKELRAVVDVMSALLSEETLNSRRLLETIEDYKVKSETDARVKRQYLEKALMLEEKATSLELKLVDKEEELARKTYEINGFGKKIKDLIQAETKARFTNGEYKAKILSQDETIKKLRSQWKALLENCKKNFAIIDGLKL